MIGFAKTIPKGTRNECISYTQESYTHALSMQNKLSLLSQTAFFKPQGCPTGLFFPVLIGLYVVPGCF